MGMRLRLGPFSVSSSGRVGASMGPLSVYGGGRRGAGGGATLLGAVLVIGLVVMVVMWPLCLWGHMLHLTPSWHQLMNRDHDWMAHHYSHVVWRFIAAAGLLLVTVAPILVSLARAAERADVERQAHEAHAYQVWLDGPPPPLTLPSRFTQNWITANVPHLHPGQVAPLLREL